jgi:hypothetical protein
MLSVNETEIKPPKLPLTISINGAITDFYFDYFMGKYFPAGYSYTVTSGYRDLLKNKQVGGAENSSHVHNLGRDFVVYKNGSLLNGPELKAFYDKYISGKWPGYSYESGKHIHVNLSRKIGIAANILAVSVFGIIGINVFAKLTKGK